jgi:hypothetical protein
MPAEPETAATWTEIVDETRAAVAAGRSVDRDALAARIRTGIPKAEADAAIAQLDRVLAVGRARARLAQSPTPTPNPSRSLRSAVKTRPILTANMDVRRQVEGETYSLAWDPASGVVEWEIRIGSRADERSDYVQLETRSLPSETNRLELPGTDATFRIHIIGRGRGGKLLRRAVVSGLSRDNWNERWQKRPSAS